MIPLAFFLVLFGQQMYEVEGVVVTATRYPVALKDVALATIVITRDEIEKLNPVTLGELLQINSGIDIKDYGNPGSVSSMSIRGTQSSGTLILLDGQPINSPLFGMADLSLINVNSIERIEIVKGPLSSLYGANGLGGVVNIVTTKKYEGPEINLKIAPSTTEAENPLQNAEIFIKTGFPLGRFDFGVEGSKEDFRGTRSNSDLDAYHINGKLGYNLGKTELKAKLSHQDKAIGVPGPLPLIDSLHPLPKFGDSTATSLYDRQGDEITRFDIQLKYGLLKNLYLEWNSFADHRKTKYNYKNYNPDFSTETSGDCKWVVNILGTTLLGVADISGIRLASGIDARYDSLNAIENSISIYEPTNDTLSSENAWQPHSFNFGGWLEAKIDAFHNLGINPSIRYDRNSSYGNFFSPQLGVVLPISSKILMKLSWGRAFRAPTFNDLNYPFGGNPDLRPEYGDAHELRIEMAPQNNLFMAISIFNRETKDKIAWQPTKNGFWQPTNVNYLSIRGIDVEVHTELGKFLEFSSEGTYLIARQKNRELIYSYYDWEADTQHTEFHEIERDGAFTPKFSISTRFLMELPYGLTVSLINSYTGQRKNYYQNSIDSLPKIFMDTKFLKSYYSTHLSLTKSLLQNLNLSIGVKNLFDIDYTTQFGNSMDDKDYPMPPRTIFAQLVWIN